MAKRLETDIVLNLAGNLANKAKQYGNSMTQFAQKNQRAMTLVKTTTAAAGRGIDRLGNRYVGMATTLATGAVVRNFATLDRRLSRLAISADITKDKATELFDEIQKVSNDKGIRVDPEQSLAAIEEILTKTGDLDYAMKNLPAIATVIQATGASGDQVGGIFTEFKKLAIDGSKEAMAAIDVLNKQGKSGAFTLASMASYGPQIFAAYAATGRKGAEAVTELGAALQVIRDGVGSDAQAVTSFEALLRDISDPARAKKLKELGNIDVFDPEKMKQGIEVMRPLPELMKEIITYSGGNSKPLALLNLTDEAKRALNTTISAYKQAGSIDLFDGFMATTGDGSVTMNDATVAAQDFSGAVQSLNTEFAKFANSRLAGPIQELADAINSVDDDTIQSWLKWGEAAAYALGTVIVAKKGLDIAVAAKTVFGKSGVPGTGGKDGFADLGVTKVFVVNMPTGGLGSNPTSDLPDSLDGGDGKKPKGSKVKSVASKALAATILYPVVESTMDALIGDTAFGKWAQSTTLGSLFSSDDSKPHPQTKSIAEAAKNYESSLTSPSAPSPWMLAGQQYSTGGNIKVDIGVTDERITTKTSGNLPGLTVNPDTGIN